MLTQSTGEWVMLAYRLPREPSTPRIALWRRLKRLGVVQLLDGLVALPADAKTREQLEWAAEEVIEAGGDATLWIGRPGTAAEERSLAVRMSETVAADYRAVIHAAEAARTSTDAAARRRTLQRLRRTLHAIAGRDYFPPPERDQARRSVDELTEIVEVAG
jgi:Protein ChrB, N-terminal